jgi:hypothetical protein
MGKVLVQVLQGNAVNRNLSMTLRGVNMDSHE